MPQHDHSRPHRKALRLQEVMDRTGMRRSFIYRELSATPPRFPRPAKVGRASIWDSDAVDAWLAARFDASV